ncbi:MAG TPA: signal recognition particle-docking protein FtsY [Nitrosopumilaceae archaeon]|nr:signal recognition particle-docking protein FtsY [Nitrosopumilaceae archaeon]
MFENLRDAFSSATKSFSEKELKEKDIDDILFQLEISLLESDVASEVIDSIKSDLKEKLIGTKVNKKEIEKFVKDSLIQSISSLFDNATKIDLFSNIDAKKETGEPYLILFVGINGTGKTTTLAKLAYLLQKSKYSIVVAAADTFRAGAIEQLREHTNRLNLKIVAQNYGSDPAAVARDAVLYAKSHKIDCVLIDTAGRMQTSKNLMEQIEKITNVVKPDFKIFVGDSLAGNDTVNQAKEFHEHTKFDAAILTKSDADARGGAALSIVKITSAPILYVGVGQEYPDLKAFDKELFLETIFGKNQSSQTITEEKKDTEPISEKKVSEPKQKEKISEPIAEPEEIKEPEVIEEQIQELEEPVPDDSDPFDGIDSSDINKYADLYDEPPPENDQQAKELSAKIKKWISDGRPKPN